MVSGYAILFGTSGIGGNIFPSTKTIVFQNIHSQSSTSSNPTLQINTGTNTFTTTINNIYLFSGWAYGNYLLVNNTSPSYIQTASGTYVAGQPLSYYGIQ